MKHIVSFETAKKLQAAGFERPKAHPGQYWYVFNEKEPTLIIEKQDHKKAKYHNAEFILDELDGVFEFTDASVERRGIYAPTATDLLEVLPDKYILSKNGNEWFCGCLNFWDDTFEGYDPKFTHENAAEAVAEAYLLQIK